HRRGSNETAGHARHRRHDQQFDSHPDRDARHLRLAARVRTESTRAGHPDIAPLRVGTQLSAPRPVSSTFDIPSPALTLLLSVNLRRLHGLVPEQFFGIWNHCFPGTVCSLCFLYIEAPSRPKSLFDNPESQVTLLNCRLERRLLGSLNNVDEAVTAQEYHDCLSG